MIQRFIGCWPHEGEGRRFFGSLTPAVRFMTLSKHLPSLPKPLSIVPCKSLPSPWPHPGWPPSPPSIPPPPMMFAAGLLCSSLIAKLNSHHAKQCPYRILQCTKGSLRQELVQTEFRNKI